MSGFFSFRLRFPIILPLLPLSLRGIILLLCSLPFSSCERFSPSVKWTAHFFLKNSPPPRMTRICRQREVWSDGPTARCISFLFHFFRLLLYRLKNAIHVTPCSYLRYFAGGFNFFFPNFLILCLSRQRFFQRRKEVILRAHSQPNLEAPISPKRALLEREKSTPLERRRTPPLSPLVILFRL